MKKFIIALTIALVAATAVFAVTPKCEVGQEFWGKRYAVLTTVSGAKHKITLPTGSALLRVKVKTGWYLINSEGVIVKYQDSAKGGK